MAGNPTFLNKSACGYEQDAQNPSDSSKVSIFAHRLASKKRRSNSRQLKSVQIHLHVTIRATLRYVKRCDRGILRYSSFSRLAIFFITLVVVIAVAVVTLDVQDSLTRPIKGPLNPQPRSFPYRLEKSVKILSRTPKPRLTNRNVKTPMMTRAMLIFSIRSRPVPPRRAPPPTKPLVRRFHHCQGLITRNALTNPSKPNEKNPFRKCSNHPASSDRSISSSPMICPVVTVSAMVPTGSSQRLSIGSAMKPSRKTVARRIRMVRPRAKNGLRSRWAHVIRSIRYW